MGTRINVAHGNDVAFPFVVSSNECKFKMELQEIMGKYYPNISIDVIMKLISNEYPEEFI